MLQAPASSNTNTTGDLFVVTAATATLTMVGNKGSLLLEGLRPHTIWFADKPARTGGQLATSEFFGNEFLQNGERRCWAWLLAPLSVTLTKAGLTLSGFLLRRGLLCTLVGA